MSFKKSLLIFFIFKFFYCVMTDSKAEWDEKELQFHSKQSFEKCLLRIKENREIFIDTLRKEKSISESSSKLFKNLKLFINFPSEILQKMDKKEMSEILSEIETFNQKFSNFYWNDIYKGISHLTHIEQKSVENDDEKAIISLLKSKTLNELIELLSEIQFRIDTKDESIDEIFMNRVIEYIPIFICYKKMDEVHSVCLHLAKGGGGGLISSQAVDKSTPSVPHAPPTDPDEEDEEEVPLVPISSLSKTEKVFTVNEDLSLRKRNFENAIEKFHSIDRPSKLEEEFLKSEKAKPKLEGESVFQSEPVYISNDTSHKTLRKPRYFNRIKMGYVWNKYNATHYTEDNPPPSQVQGYRFNIFYPDLIDKTKAPKYKVERTAPNPGNEGPNMVILRFMAGPPYEDIGFKITNKEWDVNYKNDFKCQFDRGILQLHFNFKRDRYRR